MITWWTGRLRQGSLRVAAAGNEKSERGPANVTIGPGNYKEEVDKTGLVKHRRRRLQV